VSDDRRFEPTPSRRKRAQREGNVARSSELSTTAAFAAALAASAFAVPVAASAAATALHRASPATVVTLVAAALAPACAAALGGTSAALAQGGGLHVTGIRADLSRLSPASGLRRMASADAFVGVARATMALAAAMAAVLPTTRGAVEAAAATRDPFAAVSLAGNAALRACIAALAVGATFAAVDVALTRRRWLRGLRMSLDELKRDAKENDGDPQSRARRKSAHRAVLHGGVARTREASFVVVNPTHVAVALRYAPPAVPVPEILVRAADAVAARVRAIATAHRIPIVEDVALARLLYAQGDAGGAIPLEAYVAVAEIIAALARDGAA